MRLTRAEKISVLIGAIFVAACVIAAFKPSAPGIITERSAAQNEIMTGAAGKQDELMPGDTVNINTADKAELCRLPGIGDVLAQRIIDCREKKGAFASLDEIVEDVDGIGEITFEKMRMYLVLEDDAP